MLEGPSIEYKFGIGTLRIRNAETMSGLRKQKESAEAPPLGYHTWGKGGAKSVGTPSACHLLVTGTREEVPEKKNISEEDSRLLCYASPFYLFWDVRPGIDPGPG